MCSRLAFPSNDDFWTSESEFPGMDRQVKVVKRQVNTVTSSSSSGGEPSLDDDMLGYKSEMITEGEEKKFRLNVNVKNFSPESINLTCKDRVLTIEAKTEEKSEDGNSRAYRKVSRRFGFPENVELSGITSTLSAEGILKIDAPLIKDQ